MRIKMGAVISIFVMAFCMLQGCSNNQSTEPEVFDGSKYLQESELTEAGENPKAFASSYEPVINPDYAVSVPTYITKIDDTWFIVDCYHNRVIYNDNVDDSLFDFKIMCGE